MKLGRLNHIGIATPSNAESIAFYRDAMARRLHPLNPNIIMTL